jgi:1,4-dihydroxy-2-naphthoate octaprenyltransferase
VKLFANRWWLGSRPRTLPASIVPVAIGAGCAVGLGQVSWWRVVPALIVSLALQVAVNYANDYSDGVKGTDENRVGPVRLVASGLAAPNEVKRAAIVSFAVAALAGLVLALATTLWLIPVGVACIAAGWFYTGGPSPYGYAGLGEIFVFTFFGLLATAGTTFVLSERVTGLSLLAGATTGCLACALLVVNNLRDIPTDTISGKRTLAVRLGDPRTRNLYSWLAIGALAGVVLCAANRPTALIALVGFVFAVGPIRSIRSGATGKALIAVLGMTGRLQLWVGSLLAFGLAIGS